METSVEGLTGRFVRVPAGPFLYGPEECYERLERCRPLAPQTVVDIPEFWIGRFPVTCEEWREFLERSGYEWEGRWWKIVRGWRGTFGRAFTPTNTFPEGQNRFPVVDVSQADAYAFCDWLSERTGQMCTLPDEVSWEKAARGTDGRLYPWGDQPPRPEIQWQGKGRVSLLSFAFSLVVPPFRDWARAGWYWRCGSPVEVGSVPENVSPCGCHDMSGNVWEWTSSPFHPDFPEYHVVKGGSWGYSIHHTKCRVRSSCSIKIESAVYRAPGTGFRVMIPSVQLGKLLDPPGLLL